MSFVGTNNNLPSSASITPNIDIVIDINASTTITGNITKPITTTNALVMTRHMLNEGCSCTYNLPLFSLCALNLVELIKCQRNNLTPSRNKSELLGQCITGCYCFCDCISGQDNRNRLCCICFYFSQCSYPSFWCLTFVGYIITTVNQNVQVVFYLFYLCVLLLTN